MRQVIFRLLLLSGVTSILALGGTTAWSEEGGLSCRGVGDRAPIFSLATSLDTLANYDRDYYGRHHLILTFFPAAFTPV